MVFQKKGATAVKNVQPKGKKGKKQVETDDDDIDMFKDMDDSDDFEDDSEDDMPMQKTPQNKTPKGRQSLSEKKVTFDMSSKNTPNKTPNKNNSLVGKKTPTPAKGKGALQEFKGIKGNKAQQKRGQMEEDDDDDDDDDDDEDDDLDLEIDEDDDMDEEGGEEDDDDDDDDDEDDDDDDDEDDDDEDDEEEEQKPNQKQANKQKNHVEQNKEKTPVKNENAKNQTPKAKTPKNEAVSPKKEAGPPQKNAETHNIELQRRRERDATMLYVGGLPIDVTGAELQTLSPDIKSVIIPRSNRKNMRSLFGFLCFASEAKAEANYKILQTKKFRGQLLKIDFVGEKSKNKPISSEPQINERKLYVTGIPVDATLAQVAVFFPKADQITFNKSPSFRSASINFGKIEDATEAFKSNKNIEINGSKLIVVHSTQSMSQKIKNKRKKPQKNRKNTNGNQGGNPAKKMKFPKKEEGSDEE